MSRFDKFCGCGTCNELIEEAQGKAKQLLVLDESEGKCAIWQLASLKLQIQMLLLTVSMDNDSPIIGSAEALAIGKAAANFVLNNLDHVRVSASEIYAALRSTPAAKKG